jgi:GT2 family glycosyltransferase
MTVSSISVVIPVFNGERHLAEAIDSVLAQSIAPCELIAVDDGSTDGSAQLLERYGARLTVLSQPNGGQSLARFRGTEMASGEFLAFIDQDDIWDPQKLARQIDLLQRFPAALATYCDHRCIDEAGTVTAVTGSGYGLRGSGQILSALLRGNFVRSASLVMVRRQAYELAGKFLRERFFWSDDYSMWMRIAAHGPVIYQAETLVSYRQHSGNTSGDVYEKALGDAHALGTLVDHLRAAGLTRHMNAALAAQREAMRSAAWHCIRRREFARALSYRVKAVTSLWSTQ